MVYVHLADGFEEVEALTAVDVLKRAGVDVKMVSVTGEKTVTGTHGIKVCADVIFEDADYDSCKMIVLPGGLPGAENLKNHEGLNETKGKGSCRHMCSAYGAWCSCTALREVCNYISGYGKSAWEPHACQR